MSQPARTEPIRSETEMLEGLQFEEVGRRLEQAVRPGETWQRVLAFYLVEMDARRLYHCTGHGSTAHYGEVRLGIDRRRTAELLRVGRKLRELPAIDGAFCAGRIGWVKVLVLARAASPEHEAAWLERALALSCRELAALARRSRERGPPLKAGDAKGPPLIRFPVTANLSVLSHAKLERVQAKLAAKLDWVVDITDVFEGLMDDFLASEPDGTVPGWKWIDGSLYRVVLTASAEGQASVRRVRGATSSAGSSA